MTSRSPYQSIRSTTRGPSLTRDSQIVVRASRGPAHSTDSHEKPWAVCPTISYRPLQRPILLPPRTLPNRSPNCRCIIPAAPVENEKAGSHMTRPAFPFSRSILAESTRPYFWFRRLQRPMPTNPDPNRRRLAGSGTKIAPLLAVAFQLDELPPMFRNPTI